LEWEVYVHYSYRGAIFCVDSLANHECSMEHESIFFEACWSKFSQLLVANVMGIANPKLICMYFFIFRFRPSFRKEKKQTNTFFKNHFYLYFYRLHKYNSYIIVEEFDPHPVS
jgi:hypothetical protein